LAFNVTSWSRAGRDFGRGAPPPRGSIEYVAVGDMWQAEPPRPPRPRSGTSGWQLYEVTFSDLDAGKRWIEAVDRSVRQARTAHKDQILSAEDERAWDDLMSRWRPLAHDLGAIPGHPASMLSSGKRRFDALLAESKVLHDRFARKGMSMVPVPYMGELLILLRTMPRKMTSEQMGKKLLAGVKCGEKMLDRNVAWYQWITSSDHSALERAIDDAKKAAAIFARSRRSPATFSPGDPVYDEFLRRLTRIWIEGAGLYGMREVGELAAAELKDDVRRVPEKFASTSLWLLALAGVAYLGVSWLAGASRETVVVGVPDAVPPEENET
jgi:hypothetical protein